MSDHSIQPGLVVRDVSFAYPGGLPVLNRVSLRVAGGEVGAVMGGSGSGKTTLLRLIAGLERPASGRIEIDDLPVCTDRICLKPDHRGVGLVFQEHAVFPHLSVSQNVGFALRKRSSSDRLVSVRRLLSRFQLSDFEDSMPHQLSGGQLQRVAIARALASNPRVMLLDEPFSSLDEDLRESLANMLFPILRERGTATVLVTHDGDDARRFANSLTRLDSRAEPRGADS